MGGHGPVTDAEGVRSVRRYFAYLHEAPGVVLVGLLALFVLFVCLFLLVVLLVCFFSFFLLWGSWYFFFFCLCFCGALGNYGSEFVFMGLQWQEDDG